MHALNLGYVLWAAGSCIEYLLHFGLWGDEFTPYDTRLKRAWHEFVQWARDMKITYLGLKLSFQRCCVCDQCCDVPMNVQSVWVHTPKAFSTWFLPEEC